MYLNLQNNARQLQIIEPLPSLWVAAMCGSQGVSLAVLWANLPNKSVQSMKTMAVELEALDVTFTFAIKCSDMFVFPGVMWISCILTTIQVLRLSPLDFVHRCLTF